jgi:putative intracellular protease/amidase
MLIKSDARHVQHIQKTLTQMNLHLHHVISDVTGLTGLAILAGERHPQKLAALRDRRIKATEATLAKAFAGDYRAEHLFTLKQALAIYRHDQTQVRDGEVEIERHLATLESKTSAPAPADRPPAQKAGAQPAAI